MQSLFPLPVVKNSLEVNNGMGLSRNRRYFRMGLANRSEIRVDRGRVVTVAAGAGGLLDGC